jgi:hypothetical protein
MEVIKVFLHLGDNVVIPMRDIIGIFDINSCMYSSDTSQFLRLAEEDGFVMRINEETPKSMIITEVGKKSKIYLSPISSKTLSKRTKFNLED